jgi:hypothetical protein
LLSVDRETELFVSLAQTDRRGSGKHDKYPAGIGFDIRSDQNIENDDLPCILNPDKGENQLLKNEIFCVLFFLFLRLDFEYGLFQRTRNRKMFFGKKKKQN